jgi:hypothetical protein
MITFLGSKCFFFREKDEFLKKNKNYTTRITSWSAPTGILAVLDIGFG